MKASILDRETGVLEHVTRDALVDLLARPSGVVILMSPFRRAHTELDALIEQLPARKRPPIVHRKWRYEPNAVNSLTSQINAEFMPGEEPVIALIDQPWHKAHGAWAASSDLVSLLETVASCGGSFTTVYVTPDGMSERDCLERHRSWLAANAEIHDMGEGERNAFFALRPDGEQQGFADKELLKERLGSARMLYCDAVLRVISCAFAHFAKTNDQPRWQLLILALGVDFASDARSLRDVVAEDLQPRTRGWGVETFNAGGLGQLDKTTRALGLFAKQGSLPEAIGACVHELAPISAAFAALSGWRRDTRAADGDLSDRVASVETTLRQARNVIEHTEGNARSPLFRSAIEHVVVTLEELARGAEKAMPTGASRWSLGREVWMSPLAELSAQRATELTGRGEQYLEHQLQLSTAQADKVRAVLGAPSIKRDILGLLRVAARLNKGDVVALQQRTDWAGWAQLIGLRGELGKLLGARDM